MTGEKGRNAICGNVNRYAILFRRSPKRAEADIFASLIVIIRKSNAFRFKNQSCRCFDVNRVYSELCPVDPWLEKCVGNLY